MTKIYQYTFDTLMKNSTGEFEQVQITLKARITDKQEPRDPWKRVTAANEFTKIMRQQYGMRRCCHARDLEEV